MAEMFVFTFSPVEAVIGEGNLKSISAPRIRTREWRGQTVNHSAAVMFFLFLID